MIFQITNHENHNKINLNNIIYINIVQKIYKMSVALLLDDNSNFPTVFSYFHLILEKHCLVIYVYLSNVAIVFHFFFICNFWLKIILFCFLMGNRKLYEGAKLANLSSENVVDKVWRLFCFQCSIII